MVKGVGIDLVEIDRIKKALDRWGSLLERRILTPVEIELKERTKDMATFLAGRFAAKEAVFKSLGISPCWHYVSILRGERGEPKVSLSGKILEYTEKKNIKKILVSISHSKRYAIAQAITLG